ncbi:DUF309 domain-containing protein [Paenibacillus methanolicus]|uniref:DUF309 domain-containing protein n=1 Tax=Paenibacillus methanolicus TaxID=582686 RepID=A0A5S5BZX9_9BACL|nr:DUF309 domain-containing protein [Paenibacillus methanolicus]TYP72587.1 hypothetical protein BCM02_108242 [Paenibacillus methanolicus]
MIESDKETRYPRAYVRYLVEFHATRDYFECHELLEEHWKEHPGDPFADTWVGLIQLAVGCYHHRRGNLSGAVKMFMQASNRLKAETLKELGLDGERSIALLNERRAAASAGAAFLDVQLPIVDEWLSGECLRMTREDGLIWGAPSTGDESLTERHRLRDRSDVLAAREAALKAKDGR